MRVFRACPTLAVLACLAGPAPAQLANGIKAIVNDTVITYQQVELYAAQEADLLRRQYAGQPEMFQRRISALFTNALEHLIERQLILAEFKSAGYELPDSFVEEQIDSRVREVPGGRATWIKNLQAEGITYEQYRQRIREQIIEYQLTLKNVSSELTISPYKIETYYNTHQDEFKIEDQVRLRMIVLDGSAASTPEGRRRLAEEILAKIGEGASFMEMAAVYSTGSQRREGGDWGWVERSVLRKELADVAFKLAADERSSVIETPEACYLMLVEERKSAGAKPLTEVRDEIEKSLKLREQARLRKQWIERLKDKTFVRYF